MHIELSEVLTCPDCRSPQGLVVMVEEMDDEGRVRAGDLGCSRCQRRYPVRRGEVDLLAGGDGGGGDRDAIGGGDGRGATVEAREPPEDLPPPEELAVEVGGLLDLTSARGPVVLGHGLAPAAGRLAGAAEGARILALAGAGGKPGEKGVTTLRAPAGRLPLLAGKAAGVALWRPGREAAEDARRALAPGARLALLRPDPEIRGALEESDLEVLASEERAAVARRAG